MAEPIKVAFKGRTYVWDGKHWFGEDDYTVPPLSIQLQLAPFLPSDQRHASTPQDWRGQVIIEGRGIVTWGVIAVAEVLSNGRLVESTCRDLDHHTIAVIEKAIQEEEYYCWTRSWNGAAYRWFYQPEEDDTRAKHQANITSWGKGDRPLDHPSDLILSVANPGKRKTLLLSCAIVRELWHLLTDARSRSLIECAERFADDLASFEEFQRAGAAAQEALDTSYELEGMPDEYPAAGVALLVLGKLRGVQDSPFSSSTMSARYSYRILNSVICFAIDSVCGHARQVALELAQASRTSVDNPNSEREGNRIAPNQSYIGACWWAMYAALCRKLYSLFTSVFVPLETASVTSRHKGSLMNAKIAGLDGVVSGPGEVGWDAGDKLEKRIFSLVRDAFGDHFQTHRFSQAWCTPEAVELASGMYSSRNFTRMPELALTLTQAGCDDQEIIAHCQSAPVHVRGCWVLDLILGKR
jgi:hypothetical protein